VRSDGELVLAARGGDRAAFGTLIDRHRGRVEGVVRGLLRTCEDTEDVTQEALLQAYLGLERLREPDRFGSWVTAIAANLAKMRLRQLTRPQPPPVLAPVENGSSLELLEQLRAALARLTPEQRRVVLLHDLEGRTAAEIAAELEEEPGTVRVRLHRARALLRPHLAGLEPTTRKERRTMVEVELDDVVVRVLAESDAEPTLANEHVRVVLLRERDSTRVLPIWVGPPEGDALALHLGGDTMPRPLTADLMARLLEAVGGKVERVAVSSLREKTFYAIVTVSGGAGSAEVDARPSDALNLAARIGAPIFVDRTIMDEHGIEAAERDERMQKLEDEWLEREAGESPPSRWLSVTPELVKSLYPPTGRRK
jgi:RNA polymerase sigma factor (sigma-70 family)